MFIPICLDEFIEIHLKDHPEEKSNLLRIKLESAIEAYRNGKKCSCGNDIWVAGSASNGFKCFQCTTGKPHPTGEYEIDSVINKIDKYCRRHIDEMDPRKIFGLFDDDGYEIKRDTIKTSSLCLTCRKSMDPGPEDEVLCNLNRHDQKDSKTFVCHEYERI